MMNRDRKTQEGSEEGIDRQIEAILEGADAPKTGKGSRRIGKKLRRGILLLAVLAVLLAAGLRFFAKGDGALPLAETGELRRGTITESLTVTGPVEGTDSVDVTSSLHAKILELNVREGDRVEAGVTVLARLDTADLEKEIQVSEGNYDLAVAQRDEKVQADTESYRKALQALRTAEADYNRQAALAQSGDVAQVELEKAADALEEARQTVSAFRVQGGKVLPEESMEIQIRNAELALQQTKERLEDAVILAPISGTVTRVNTKVGQFADDIEDNKPMITIENLDSLQMEIKVSEYSIGKVKPGQPVTITADILGEGNSVAGTVLSISPTGEEKGGGSTERVIPTKIGILEDSALIAGITAKARIALDQAEDVWVVPISAIGDDGSGQASMEFVEQDGQGRSLLRIVPVRTGLESDLEAEILGPVREADAGFFQEGQPYLTTYQTELGEGAAIRTQESTVAQESRTTEAPDEAASGAEASQAETETSQAEAEEGAEG